MKMQSKKSTGSTISNSNLQTNNSLGAICQRYASKLLRNSMPIPIIQLISRRFHGENKNAPYHNNCILHQNPSFTFNSVCIHKRINSLYLRENNFIESNDSSDLPPPPGSISSTVISLHFSLKFFCQIDLGQVLQWLEDTQLLCRL